MCYAYPGPRCSNHCFRDLSKARTAYLSAVEQVETTPEKHEAFQAAKARFERAQARYDRSPEGVRSLRDEAASIRATDPERAEALETLAEDGERVHTKEVGVAKRKTEAEERTFVDLCRQHNEAYITAENLARQVSEDAAPEERERLAEQCERVQELFEQSSTTPLGLRMLREDYQVALKRRDSATSEDQRQVQDTYVEFHRAGYAKARARREQMLAEYRANMMVREKADAYMAEARATGGLAVLDR